MAKRIDTKKPKSPEECESCKPGQATAKPPVAQPSTKQTAGTQVSRPASSHHIQTEIPRTTPCGSPVGEQVPIPPVTSQPVTLPPPQVCPVSPPTLDNTDIVLSVNGKTGHVTLRTADVPEYINLYFTAERAQQAARYAFSALDPLSYNINTGVFSLIQTHITALGTIGIGTWGADPIAIAFGGTGVTSWVKGGILAGTGASSTTILPPGINGAVLIADSTKPSGLAWSTAILPSAGVTSFNTRTGDVVLNYNDVTTALGYGLSTTPAPLAIPVSDSNGKLTSWISVFTGTSPGLVPASTYMNKFLRSDGAWVDIQSSISSTALVLVGTATDDSQIELHPSVGPSLQIQLAPNTTYVCRVHGTAKDITNADNSAFYEDVFGIIRGNDVTDISINGNLNTVSYQLANIYAFNTYWTIYAYPDTTTGNITFKFQQKHGESSIVDVALQVLLTTDSGEVIGSVPVGSVVTSFNGRSGDVVLQTSDIFTNTSPGIVPAPGSQNGYFLRDDGSWVEITSGGGGGGGSVSNGVTVRNIVTDDTPTELFTDGSAAEIALYPNSSYLIRVSGTARNSADINDVAYFEDYFGVARGVNTNDISIDGSNNTTDYPIGMVYADTSGWELYAHPNLTTGNIAYYFKQKTGETKTISVACEISVISDSGINNTYSGVAVRGVVHNDNASQLFTDGVSAQIDLVSGATYMIQISGTARNNADISDVAYFSDSFGVARGALNTEISIEGGSNTDDYYISTVYSKTDSWELYAHPDTINGNMAYYFKQATGETKTITIACNISMTSDSGRTTGGYSFADGLRTSTTNVLTATADAPIAGQVLTATDASTAIWEYPTAGLTVSCDVANDVAKELFINGVASDQVSLKTNTAYAVRVLCTAKNTLVPGESAIFDDSFGVFRGATTSDIYIDGGNNTDDYVLSTMYSADPGWSFFARPDTSTGNIAYFFKQASGGTKNISVACVITIISV